MKTKKPFIYEVTDSGCHQVTSHKPMKKSGYIPRNISGTVYYAHRLVYEEHNGPIPEGLVVRHKCDNPPCINPEHLELGTHVDNLNDKIARGRQLRGEGIGNSKLTEQQARDIKYNTEMTQAQLSRKYNVSNALVCRIKQGKYWAHI